MRVNDFPFSEFLKNSWRLTIKNRLLWILGLFVGTSGFFVNFNFQDWFKGLGINAGKVASIGVFIENAKNIFFGAKVIVLIVAAFFIFLFLLFLVSLIARGAILTAIAKVKLGEAYGFWSLVKAGARRIWTLLLLEVVLGIVNAVFVGVSLAALFSFDNLAIKILFAIAVILMIIYSFFVSLFKHYVYCYAVLEGNSAWLAIKSGFDLLRKNFWILLVTKLIEVGLMIAVGVALIIACAILLLPIILIGVVAMFIFGATALIVIALLAALVIIVFIFLLRGATATFFQSFATEVYWATKK